ncbi:hypothetical protein [Qipengyuania sp.]|uniref:hypothetical protein n=1 Tax=Qipengyuania sp. TaxID=2004515 RepID=UPI0035C83E07
MTKLRPPLSIDQALARIAGQLEEGYESIAAITDRSVSMARAWGDPDRREKIPVDDAIALDLAYQEAGGVGAPLYEAYGAKLDVAAAARFSSKHQLLERTERLIKEGGEAHAALVRACQPGATAAEVATALRELGEAFEEYKPIFAILEQVSSDPSAWGQPSTRAPP